MTHFHLFDPRRRDTPASAEPVNTDPLPEDLDPPSSEFLEEAPAPAWSPRADRRTTTEKVSAGLAGVKYAVRGDSSFFAHAYRGLLIATAAAIAGS